MVVNIAVVVLVALALMLFNLFVLDDITGGMQKDAKYWVIKIITGVATLLLYQQFIIRISFKVCLLLYVALHKPVIFLAEYLKYNRREYRDGYKATGTGSS